MAIALEFVNVILRKPVLEQQYPGGVEALIQLQIPNFVEDEHLVRIGYMSTREADDLMYALSTAGLSLAVCAAMITSTSETPDWLMVGEVDHQFACWLANEPAGKVVHYNAGFMLRCSLQLYDQLDQLFKSYHITLTREPASLDKDLMEILTCYRDTAKIEIEIFCDEYNSPIGMWGRNNFSQRAQATANNALLKDLEALLTSNGAEKPGWD
jgi:hypothetical protein